MLVSGSAQMSYENTWEKYGVYRKFGDHITGREVLKAVQEVEGDARFDSVRYVISDFLDVIEQDISPRDVEIIAAIDRVAARSNSKFKVAVVATLPSIRELAALYTELSHDAPFPSRLFDRIDEAREWVKIPR